MFLHQEQLFHALAFLKKTWKRITQYLHNINLHNTWGTCSFKFTGAAWNYWTKPSPFEDNVFIELEFDEHLPYENRSLSNHIENLEDSETLNNNVPQEEENDVVYQRKEQKE